MTPYFSRLASAHGASAATSGARAESSAVVAAPTEAPSSFEISATDTEQVTVVSGDVPRVATASAEPQSAARPSSPTVAVPQTESQKAETLVRDDGLSLDAVTAHYAPSSRDDAATGSITSSVSIESHRNVRAPSTAAAAPSTRPVERDSSRPSFATAEKTAENKAAGHSEATASATHRPPPNEPRPHASQAARLVRPATNDARHASVNVASPREPAASVDTQPREPAVIARDSQSNERHTITSTHRASALVQAEPRRADASAEPSSPRPRDLHVQIGRVQLDVTAPPVPAPAPRVERVAPATTPRFGFSSHRHYLRGR